MSYQNGGRLVAPKFRADVEAQVAPYRSKHAQFAVFVIDCVLHNISIISQVLLYVNTILHNW